MDFMQDNFKFKGVLKP